MRFSLYALYALARGRRRGGADDYDFDIDRLPMEIYPHVNIEDISGFLEPRTFDIVRTRMGTDAVRKLEQVRYALVHRFEPDEIVVEDGVVIAGEGRQAQDSKKLLRNIAACLRIIRPTRQLAQTMSGNVRDDGSFDVLSFDSPIDLMEVPQNQKHFNLREQDAETLQELVPEFLRLMEGEFWKFRMAVQFHDLGHFQYFDWKARYLLWSSAIESIYTSHGREHKGSLVAKERIKWFLGENTSIYPQGELSSLLVNPGLSVTDVVGDLYELRNFIAHGDRIPDRYFTEARRNGFNGAVTLRDVLLEAASFIVRSSLVKILRDRLGNDFQDAPQAEAFFSAQNLTHSELARAARA